jgi:hypothetical protein
MIHFICALKCEAGPLLDHFGLEHHRGDNLFNSYFNEETQTSLTITGVGKINAAAGTMHAINNFHAQANDIWINIGIAGHRTLPLGSPLLANRILDAATPRVWFPQILLATPYPSCALTTVDTPVTRYGEGMFDMEAAGFYSSACRIGTAELIHCLKVISDNEQSPSELLGARQISALIAGQLSLIEEIILKLLDLSTELPGAVANTELFDLFTARWHFTEYQRIRLQFLLNRCAVLAPEFNPLTEHLREQRSGAEVLASLKQHLDTLPVDCSPAAIPVSGFRNT